MIVYHGTANWSIKGILKTGPHTRPRVYVHSNRPSFCTTTDFQIAALFAFRKISTEDYAKGLFPSGVMEFELSGEEGLDYEKAVDGRCIQDEKEIVVYNVKRLKLKAIWRNHNGQWERKKSWRTKEWS